MQTIQWVKNALRLPQPEGISDLRSWRLWLRNILIIALVVIGYPLSMVITLPMFLHQGHYAIIVLDGVFFLFALWHVLRRGHTFLQHPAYWIMAVYVLTITFHIAMGPLYARPAWLMVCTVATALIYGTRAAFLSVFVNILLLMALYFSLGPSSPVWAAAWAAPAPEWYSYVINLSLLSLAVSLPMGFLMEHLDRVLKRERLISRDLKAEIAEREKAQTALEEQEKRYRMLAENASDVVWAMDLEGNYTYLSPAAARLSGYSQDEIQNMRMGDFFEPDELARLESAMTEELAKPPEERRTTATMELRQRTREGKTIDIEFNASWVTDEAGHPIGIQGIARDITRRKQTERQLKESRRLLAQALDFLPDATFAIDTEGKVLFWNRAIEKLTGTPAQEIVGRGDYAYAVPFYGERRPIMIDLVRSWDEETAQKYHNVKKRNGLLISETINPPFIKRPSVFWNAACRLYDEDGRDLGAIETIRDITEIRRAERAVRESEYRFRSFFNSSPEGIVLMDLEGCLQNFNKAFLLMSGYFFDELAGLRLEDIVPEAFHDEARRAVHSVKTGIVDDRPLELALRKKDGHALPVSLRGWLITDDDSAPVAVGGFVKDISQEKALQREKSELENQLIQNQKMQAVGTLAGGIAHDFNNLLGAIVSYTELSLTELPAGEISLQDSLRQILAASGKATELVRQILRFSRQESVVLKRLSLTPLLKEVLKLLQSTIPRHITITPQFGAEQDTVMADATQIHQVIMNLCTNAYQVMQADGGTMTVALKDVHLERPEEFMDMRLPSGDYVELTVSDTGTGIPGDRIDRIFEPYFTTKTAGEGTGLGLAVTLGIVKNHHGLISVDSRPGHGTTFRILLPPVKTKASAEREQLPDLPLGRGQHILIVDDEHFFVDVIQRHLERLGYRASAFQSSRAAWDDFQADPDAFELVITDQTMPEMTGLELTQKIRRISPTIPIILCSGFSEAVTREILKRYHIAEYLMKPISQADLARTVHKVLEG